MARLGDIPARPDYAAVAAAEGLPSLEADLQAEAASYQTAAERAGEARVARDQARAEYEFRREEYRVALEKGLDDPALAASHESAKSAYEEAEARYQIAEAARANLETDLSARQKTYDDVLARVSKAFDRANGRYEVIAFILRFAYALPLFALSVWLWLALRRRRPRHLILATAFMAFAGLQALGLLGQYGWYLLRDVGQIALSVAGSAVCVAGLIAIQRWAANARRLTLARLRRRQCPGCGFPLTPGAAYCAGCGRKLTSTCPRCGQETLIEAPFCSNCGLARG